MVWFVAWHDDADDDDDDDDDDAPHALSCCPSSPSAAPASTSGSGSGHRPPANPGVTCALNNDRGGAPRATPAAAGLVPAPVPRAGLGWVPVATVAATPVWVGMACLSMKKPRSKAGHSLAYTRNSWWKWRCRAGEKKRKWVGGQLWKCVGDTQQVGHGETGEERAPITERKHCSTRWDGMVVPQACGCAAQGQQWDAKRATQAAHAPWF